MAKEWLYRNDGKDKVRYCPDCLFHEIKNAEGEWISLITAEHADWIYAQLAENKDTECKECIERWHEK